jgi:hypothetical protein
MPPAYVIYWLTLVPKDRLRCRHVWPWLAFPVVYAVASLGRGASLCSAPASLAWA